MSEEAGGAPGEWRRTSRLGYLVGAIVNLRNALLPMAAALLGTQGLDKVALYVLPSFGAVLGLTLFFSWLGWRHFRYQIGDSDIRVERGLFNRTARSVPYERIQDVSLEQSLVPRLFGMVQVKFETGAGGKDELKIQYVTEAEGAALRETVRTRKSGEPAAAGEIESAPEAEGRTLFAMDTRRLATFGLFEFSLVVFAVLGGAAQQFEFLLPFELWNPRSWIGLFAGPGHWLQELGFAAQAIGAAIAVTLLAIVGLLTGLGRTVLRDYGFKLEQTPKGLRRRRGLLTRTDVVIPIHRVQALKVTTGILRRQFGWHGLEIVSLGLDEKSGSHVVVPFATMAEIAPVVRVTGFDLPGGEVTWRKASARYRRNNAVLSAAIPILLAIAVLPLPSLLPGEAGFPIFLPSLVFAALAGFFALREHFLWRHERHALDGNRLYVRRGWLAPRLDIAAPVKLQSVEIAQGPLARRDAYASLKFGVAGGTLEIEGIPLPEARAIRDAVLARIAPVDFSQLPG